MADCRRLFPFLSRKTARLVATLMGLAVMATVCRAAAQDVEDSAVIPALHRDLPREFPSECFRPDLPDEVQRACDRIRFHGEPHYLVVRLAHNGAVRSIRLVETEAGREAVAAYPYGLAFAAPRDDDREWRLRVEHLERLVGGLPTPGSTQPAPQGYATGLPIGWNPSTGATPGQCFNYTIATPSNNVSSVSFSSQDAASSTAEQIKVSATVKTSVDLFKAKDTASFSDQWQSSSFSGNQYYNFYSLYTLDSTVDATNPLNAQGTGAGSSFGSLCGSQYMSAVPVGIVATVSINYGSTSESTQTQIANSFKASEGLESVKFAVSTSNSATESTSYFTFTMVSYGGGSQATADLINAFAATNSTGEAYYALCAQGNTAACDQFSSNMGVGASNALASLSGLVKDLSTQTNPDLSFFESFPNGVAGADVPSLVTTDVPVPTSDVLEPYADHLSQYVTLLNQIATLYNRAGALDDLLAATPELNPTPVLDLRGYLQELEDTYGVDRATLLRNLENCLAATSSNVTSVCAPIINNVSANAYEYYATGQPRANFLAQQNTIALQYTSTVGLTGSSITAPYDVMYIAELPPLTFAGSAAPITGDAAFVVFLDRPIAPAPVADVELLPLVPNMPISTENVASEASGGTTFTLWNISGVPLELFSYPGAMFAGTGACTPTIDALCAIDYTFTLDDDKLTVLNRGIRNLF